MSHNDQEMDWQPLAANCADNELLLGNNTNSSSNSINTQNGNAESYIIQQQCALTESITDCAQCVGNSIDRNPFDVVIVCQNCLDQWVSFLPNHISRNGNHGNVSHMLSDMQIRLTRTMANELVDAYGFGPNTHGYYRNCPVLVTLPQKDKGKMHYIGILSELKQGKVKVWIPEFQIFEWLPTGSRRLIVVNPQEEENMLNNNNECLDNKETEYQKKLPKIPNTKKAKLNQPLANKSTNKRKAIGLSKTSPFAVSSQPTDSSVDDLLYKHPTNIQPHKTKHCFNDASNNHDTRPIMSLRIAQLKAAETEHFVPNVHGYYHMQHVRVLYNDKQYYEARIVGMQKNKVKVHYCGWTDDFDELISLGSRRIQAIENDDMTKCLEPHYNDYYQQLTQVEDAPLSSDAISICNHSNQNEIIQQKDVAIVDVVIPASEPSVYCSQCKIEIKQFRYYCSYCEVSSSSLADDHHQRFQLCLVCFEHCFPTWHQHPRSGFAIQAVANNASQEYDTNTIWELDVLQEQDSLETPLESSQVFTGIDDISSQDKHGYLYLQRWKDRKICGFCNDDDDNSPDLGPFIGPFISSFIKLGQEKQRIFWVHDACARYSPEVSYSAQDGKWYNVTRALKRGRSMRCHGCKEKGATIGCFNHKCYKSFHLACTGKPINNFKNGVIFWCTLHEAMHEKQDDYINVFHCDGCSKKFSQDESWFTCEQCSEANYFSSFDLCNECYNNQDSLGQHHHDKADYKAASYSRIEQVEAEKQARQDAANNSKKKAQLFPRRPRKLPNGSTPMSCCYCGTNEADVWRKGYDGGIIMCNSCFEVIYATHSEQTDATLVAESYIASIEDYSHKPYFTRDTLSFTKSLIGPRLTSYEPQPHQLFSLTFDSTYFDIPGRAPRWASHSGTDYHGTWLPQTVRRALLRYTQKDERILSNFLGRGTDAIECFLLQRKCCGIDINPAAVALSQRNCCFEVPAGLTFAEYRPIIALADARQLNGSLFQDESYHHILSHPPYKDCVAYSTHLEGDLSRFTHIDDFKHQYTRVIQESYRVLKMDRRLTLGIGDNREQCFYVPVGFHLLRLYIDQGFELEELIVKRQRYCSAFGLGTYLCVQFDFLVFTHEFIVTFRKIPPNRVDKMYLTLDYDSDTVNNYCQTLYGIPSSAISRKSRVMGTVWTFKQSDQYTFSLLCVSRMIERFGQDDCNWLHVELPMDMSKQEHDRQRESGPCKVLPKTTSATEVKTISEYEQKRQRKIQENNETLLKLGLISDLGQESVVNDGIYCDTMLSMKSRDHADLVVMATGHIENLPTNQINRYRRLIIQLAQDAMVKLAVKGMLIVGTMDIRDHNGKLWPISMLVLEDIERTCSSSSNSSGLRLKEMVITVPEGYSKNRDSLVIQQEYEYLPIVHAIYLIFQKQ